MLIVFSTIITLVTLCILVHYEVLLRLSELLKHSQVLPRLRIVVALVGALFAHVIEIFIFACGYFLLGQFPQFGKLVATTGEVAEGFADFTYFSFSTYTSLGFGDIVPIGALRYVAGMEVLLGLVLIAWTASFIYVEMQRFWKV